MSCGLLPLCYHAMVLGEVPFCDVDGDQQQLTAAIGSSSKVTIILLSPTGQPVSKFHRINHS